MAKKVSVIIPNYNGEDLLKFNLPKVIKYCKGCEIIIVDDASTDSSIKLIKNSFKNIKLIENKKNVGFTKSINKGVKSANGELILLLNSDVAPRQGFLPPALKLFKDRDLFAIALSDFSHESGQVIKRGKGGANFKNGFIHHFKLPSSEGETLWVSGGSGLFDKEKFLNLEGFDASYEPFYWEDIDLSFRAWRKGWKCVFEPESRVDHFHEKGAIKKSSSKFFVKIVSYKNQFIFVWKNIDDYLLIIQHILWFPIHVAKALVSLDAAFFIGFFWAITKVPPLVFNFERSAASKQLSEKEILKKFEKQ